MTTTCNATTHVHPRAHQPLNRYCVHCGRLGRAPECVSCREAATEPKEVDDYTGFIITDDGDEIGLISDPYRECMELV